MNAKDKFMFLGIKITPNIKTIVVLTLLGESYFGQMDDDARLFIWTYQHDENDPAANISALISIYPYHCLNHFLP